MLEINKLQLTGRLTRNPDLKYLGNFVGLCKFSIAVNRRFKNKDGEWKTESFFMNVNAWGKNAEWCGDNLQKGDEVYVSGRMTVDSWEDKETGDTKTKMELTAANEPMSVQRIPKESKIPSQGTAVHEPIPEDDIPF